MATSKTSADGKPYYAPIPTESSKKAVRQKQEIVYRYNGRDGYPLVRVIRKDDGNGKKTFSQEQFDGQYWVKGLDGLDRSEIPIYNLEAVKKAVAKGETVYFVEGESCVETLKAIGLTATTNLRGSGQFKQSDAKDLQGAKLVICPDRDKPGIKSAEAIAEFFPDAPWLYAFPDSPFWNNPPQSQGLDIADWIADGATKEIIEGAIEPRRMETRSLGEIFKLNKQYYKEEKTLGDAETLAQIEKILELDLPEWQRTARLDEVREKSKLSKESFNQLLANLSVDPTSAEAIEQLEETVSRHGDKANLLSIFPDLGKSFYHDATKINADPMVIVMPFLAQTMSLFSKNAYLDLEGWKVSPNIYVGLVGDSSTGKTRGSKIAISPINELDDEEKHAHSIAFQDWEDSLPEEKGKKGKPDKNNPAPMPRRFSFNVGTIQSVMKKMGSQEKGALWHYEELKGLFGSLNQFSSGKAAGEGMEVILGLWDAEKVRVDRVKDEDSYETSAPMSIYGAIQPKLFESLFSGENNDRGLTARFLFAQVKMQQPRGLVRGACVLPDFLPGFYRYVDSTYNTPITLSKEAWAKFESHYLDLETAAYNRPEGDPIRSWLMKLIPNTGKLALFVHAIDCYHNPKLDRTRISGETMDRAILLANHFRSVFQDLQARGEEANETNILTKIWQKAIAMGKAGLSPRDCLNRISHLNRLAKDIGISATEFCLERFRELEGRGMGMLEKVGKTFRFLAKEPPKKEQAEPVNTQNSVDKVEEIKLELVDKAVEISSAPENLDDEGKSESPTVTAKSIGEVRSVSIDKRTGAPFLLVEGLVRGSGATFKAWVRLTDTTPIDPFTIDWSAYIGDS